MSKVTVVLDREAEDAGLRWNELAKESKAALTLHFTDALLEALYLELHKRGEGVTILDTRKGHMLGAIGAMATLKGAPLLVIGARDYEEQAITEAVGDKIRFLPTDATEKAEHIATILAFMRGGSESSTE